MGFRELEDNVRQIWQRLRAVEPVGRAYDDGNLEVPGFITAGGNVTANGKQLETVDNARNASRLDVGTVDEARLPFSEWADPFTSRASGWTWNEYRARRLGPLVQIVISITRTGSTLSVIDNQGNIGDTQVGILAPEYRPYNREPVIGQRDGYFPVAARIIQNGEFDLVGSSNSNASINTGDTLIFSAMYFTP